MSNKARRCLTAFTVVASAAALACCGGADTKLPPQSTPSPRASAGGLPPRHIAVIVMENEEYADIIGSNSTPYVNSLAKQYALATRMFAVTHPSLPNYIALTSGSTHGISSDCTGCSVPGSGLVGQLARMRISWKAYMESLPYRCFKGAAAGEYAKKHDPFIYFKAVAGTRSLCDRIVPLSQLAQDERNNRLPRFLWISPNLCHDMHDCAPSIGDHFLSILVPPLLRAFGSSGLLFLTWDEGVSDKGCCKFASGGHVVTVLAGPSAKPGARMTTPVDHYSVLQTIEDLLGVRRLARAGCPCTPSLQPLLAGH